MALKSVSEHALEFTNAAANITSILLKNQTNQAIHASAVISELSSSCVEIGQMLAEEEAASRGLSEYLGLMALIKVHVINSGKAICQVY